MQDFFLKPRGLRGRMAYHWLNRQEKSEARQSFADLLDSKPVLEFEFENGKLNKVKLGFGVGKRLKLFERAAPAPTTQTTLRPSREAELARSPLRYSCQNSRDVP